MSFSCIPVRSRKHLYVFLVMTRSYLLPFVGSSYAALVQRLAKVLPKCCL